MGFYAPAQIVRDAREHGVTVLHPDVAYSSWDSTLEVPPQKSAFFALRLGLREVDGLRQADAARIGPGTIADMQRRGVPVPALEKLAAADCFRALGLDRRAALWEVKALARSKPLPLFAFAEVQDQGGEPAVTLPAMPLSEHVVNDYQTLRLSLKAHPMSFLREACRAEGVIDNAQLKRKRNGANVAVAGVVLVRQRPGSAKGVVFLTLEDECAVCNAVIWPQVLEAHRAVVMGARLMLIRGRVQRTGDIIHVVASRILDRSHWLARLAEDHAGFRAPLARADEVVRPGPDPAQTPAARHPRQMRVIPRSRDFH
jgi:error-prone DNA polymerase